MRAVGLMSGTSGDGVDAALIETDGEAHVRPVRSAFRAYDEGFRARLRAACAAALAMDRPGAHPGINAVADELTRIHALATADVLAGESADVVGFHGQTVAHRPERGWTWQVGDGALLARLTGLPVVADFRAADVAAGGQGAPLAPGYHRALAVGLPKPLAVLNLGGVGNVTWFASDGRWGAFDTGPGNALLDDWMMAEAGLAYDDGGRAAAAGEVHADVLTAMLDHPWFDMPPPKSLDRDAWSLAPARGLTLADGAATLAAFTAETVRLALGHVPEPLARLLVTGGGRHNRALMAEVARRTGAETLPVEATGWRGDALEAEAFAWAAVRSLQGLPISWPETTGVPVPTAGGRLFRPG